MSLLRVSTVFSELSEGKDSTLYTCTSNIVFKHGVLAYGSLNHAKTY